MTTNSKTAKANTTARNAKKSTKALATKPTTKYAPVAKRNAKESKPEAKKISQIEAAILVLGKSNDAMNCNDTMNCKAMVEAMHVGSLWSSSRGATLYASTLPEINTRRRDVRFGADDNCQSCVRKSGADCGAASHRNGPQYGAAAERRLPKFQRKRHVASGCNMPQRRRQDSNLLSILGNSGCCQPNGADSGALPKNPINHGTSETVMVDPDLNAIIAAWPTLPPAIRAGVIALVRAGGGQHE
ncbi:MAG TPA: hypothetical protein PKA76_16000 [Pirellulaceae bacterium]|nr:hypothetical protein [Pirellulaceae bacterium]HMP70850.1 hypothetical protein [Pirellulaceae bacterium]